jgi:hypothetical protein
MLSLEGCLIVLTSFQKLYIDMSKQREYILLIALCILLFGIIYREVCPEIAVPFIENKQTLDMKLRAAIEIDFLIKNLGGITDVSHPGCGSTCGDHTRTTIPLLIRQCPS